MIAYLDDTMLTVENNHQLAESSRNVTPSEHVSVTKPPDRTELDDLLDELLGQADTAPSRRRSEQRRTPPGSLIYQACSQASVPRRRTPQPMARNDSLSALRLTPSINSSPQPLHARLQIDIAVDQRTGSARIDSWSPVSFDSVPVDAGYSSYGKYNRPEYDDFNAVI